MKEPIMKPNVILMLITLLIFYGCANSKPATGYWVGTMEMAGKVVDISIDFNSGSASFSSSDLMLRGEDVSNLESKNGNISFSIISDAQMIFEGKIENEKINGSVSIQGGPPNMKIKYILMKESDTSSPKLYSIEKLTIKSKDVNLSAEIFKPKTNKLHPALVLLHGSSTNLKKQYYFYADYFANLGFEVMIFDKRGNGESTGNNVTSTYENLAEDVIACLESLKNRQTVDKGKIGLWGISQGGMLLPFIASKTEIPSFLIAVSPEVNGPAEAGAYADSLRIINRGNSTKDGQLVAESHRKVGEMIRIGNSYKEVEKYINQNVQEYPFMNQTALYGNLTITKDDFDGLYWSGRKYNFYSYWKNLNIKTLVIFGEDDDLVNPLKNNSIIKSLNNNKIETKIFSRANHIIKKTFNPTKYPDFDWPRVKDGYLEFVENWVENEIIK